MSIRGRGRIPIAENIVPRGSPKQKELASRTIQSINPWYELNRKHGHLIQRTRAFHNAARLYIELNPYMIWIFPAFYLIGDIPPSPGDIPRD